MSLDMKTVLDSWPPLKDVTIQTPPGVKTLLSSSTAVFGKNVKNNSNFGTLGAPSLKEKSWWFCQLFESVTIWHTAQTLAVYLRRCRVGIASPDEDEQSVSVCSTCYGPLSLSAAVRVAVQGRQPEISTVGYTAEHTLTHTPVVYPSR